MMHKDTDTHAFRTHVSKALTISTRHKQTLHILSLNHSPLYHAPKRRWIIMRVKCTYPDLAPSPPFLSLSPCRDGGGISPPSSPRTDRTRKQDTEQEIKLSFISVLFLHSVGAGQDRVKIFNLPWHLVELALIVAMWALGVAAVLGGAAVAAATPSSVIAWSSEPRYCACLVCPTSCARVSEHTAA